MVSRSVVRLVSWSVGQLPGCSVDQLVSRSVGHWSGGWSSVGRLVGWSFRWLVVGHSRSVDWSFGQLVSRWLGQLVNRSVGQLASRSLGWSAGLWVD